MISINEFGCDAAKLLGPPSIEEQDCYVVWPSCELNTTWNVFATERDAEIPEDVNGKIPILEPLE